MPAPLETRIIRSMTEVSAEDWDSLSQGQPFSSHRWFCFAETLLSSIQPGYTILLYLEGRLVARCTFWLVTYELFPRRLKWMRGVLEKMIKQHPLLACRSPLSGVSGLFLPDPPLRATALLEIIRAAKDLAHQLHASFIVFDYLQPDQAELPEWPAQYSKYQVTSPGTYLPIQWKTYEEYLKSLSKSTWKDYRRQRNHAADMNLEVTVSSQVESMDEAEVLIHNVEQKYSSTPNRYIRQVIEHAGMLNSSWIQAKIGGKLVGCGLLLEDNGAQLATLLGIDYTYQYIYFQLMYTIIRIAIEQGSKKLIGGSGVYDLKERLGFQKDENNWIRFSGQGGLFNLLGRLVVTL